MREDREAAEEVFATWKAQNNHAVPPPEEDRVITDPEAPVSPTSPAEETVEDVLLPFPPLTADPEEPRQ
jgi:hypothetical protein